MVKQARLSRRMSQRRLSSALGMSEGYVGHLEGGRTRPTVGTLKAIASARGLPYGRLALAAGSPPSAASETPLTESPLPEESPDHPPNVGSCVYAVSKIAIRAFTRSVAVEERRYNICIMSVGPGTEGSGGPLIGAGLTRAGIITDDSPEWAHEAGLSKRVETVGNRYVLAAAAGLEFSGHQLAGADGQVTLTRARA